VVVTGRQPLEMPITYYNTTNNNTDDNQQHFSIVSFDRVLEALEITIVALFLSIMNLNRA